MTFDSRSFAPQLRGEKGTPREWVFVQLGAQWYVREQGFKLTQGGELFDMSDAPFVEKPVAAADQDRGRRPPERLQAVLDKLSPATGKTSKKSDQNQVRQEEQTATRQLIMSCHVLRHAVCDLWPWHSVTRRRSRGATSATKPAQTIGHW